MNKLEKLVFDNDGFNEKKYIETKYNYLFKPQIIYRGLGYYFENKVTNVEHNKNIISAVIKGTKDYKISIKNYGKDNIEVKCECPYHQDTDIYCKHVFALIISLELPKHKEELKNIYNNVLNKFKDTNEKTKKLVEENKEYIEESTYSWINNLLHQYEKIIKSIDTEFDNDECSLLYTIPKTYFELNSIINKYNYMVEKINDGKFELELKKKEEKERRKKQKEKESDNEDNTTSYTWTIGEGLFDYLDDVFASQPLEVLEKVKEDDIKNGRDTEIMDKAIKERKRRDEIIRRKYELELRKQKEELARLKKIQRKRLRKLLWIGAIAFIKGAAEGLSEMDHYYPKKRSKKGNLDFLMGWEEDLVNKGEYEPYNFEEEEMEEEDYYYEDD